jgi:hypothetical protein
MCRVTNLAALVLYLTTLVSNQLNARDDGRFANSPLKPWFDRLASGKGLCCSFADGFSVQDVDWDTQDGHYRVRIYGQWFVVPDDAVVAEPNRFGPTVVWPITTATATHKFAASCLVPVRSLGGPLVFRFNFVLSAAIGIVTALMLTTCASPSRVVWEYYDQCARENPSFLAMAGCGRQKRLAECVPNNTCSPEGNMFMEYVDTLVLSVKKKELTEAEAMRRYTEYKAGGTPSHP